MDSSKKLATSAQKLLKEMGHEVPLGHMYELFSKLSGQPSWNVAKTKEGFSPVLVALSPYVGEGTYEVKIVNEDNGIEIKKYYRVAATSEKEAEEIVQAYVKYRCDEDDSKLDFHPGVKALAEAEDESEFIYKNWEIIDNRFEPTIQKNSTYKIEPK